MKTLHPAMLHKVTALQPVRFRTMVTRDVETRVADHTVNIPHTQDEWVFLKKGETYLSSSPIIAIHPDYMPQERTTRNAGVPMIMIPAAPRPLEFCDLLRLELVPAPPPEPPAPDAWA
jgi:hypothetical protein